RRGAGLSANQTGVARQQAWRLLRFKIFRRLFAAISDDFILNVLAFVERAQPGPLHGGDVNEHILATALRLDKAVTFGRVDPLTSAFRHSRSPSLKYAKRTGCPSDRLWRLPLYYPISAPGTTAREAMARHYFAVRRRADLRRLSLKLS